MLRLYNSMGEKKEDFIPLDPNSIKIYSCGITVYDRMHLGHARTYIFVDLLVRILKKLYKNVAYARNITDIDDKIIRRSAERGVSIRELTDGVIQLCDEDFEYLQILKPTFEPRATETMKEIIEIIQMLIDKGCAYESNNHVLFSVKKYGDYGKLSHKNYAEMELAAAGELGGYKRNPLDFVLW
ncbi:MAG: class I tRNA ligase family protein, partial [Rickettsiales bacterium]|nr:class I tRNA ligase family protein [Rickettsiales bacterium]